MRLSLSSTALKLIAIATMLADHIGFLFFPGEIVWRVVGRLAFPLFAFLIAEGFEKTSNVGRYGKRLILFAAISQLPYSLVLAAANVPQTLNIFFTLSIGLLALALLKSLPYKKSVPLVGMILFAAEYLHFDYGAYGVLTILASHLFIHRKTAGGIALVFLPIFDCLVLAFTGVLSLQFFALFSVPLIALYRGERGMHLPRAFFYWFYPVHLFILWLIWYYLSYVAWSIPLS